MRVISRRRDAEFYAVHFKGEKQPAEAIRCPFSEYLPPRNKWTRPKRAQREALGTAAAIFECMIVRTVMGYRERGTLLETAWGKKLQALVDEVQARVREEKFELTPPKLKFIRKSGDEYRMLASYENVSDRIILRGASEYLKAVFDLLLDERCYSFRLSRKKSNKAAIDELVKYRQGRKGEVVYVAECDIQKFFDVLNHEKVLEVYDAFVARCAMVIDGRGRKVLEAYLDSYDSNEYPVRVAQEDAEVREKLPHVKRVKEEVLQELYGAALLGDLRLGIPQGGALSPLIANMFLTDVDGAVQAGGKDENLFYVRFCDDMIIAHTEKGKCAAAMERYMEAVREKFLPVHQAPEGGFVYGKVYYGLKTKGPFAWKSAAVGAKDEAPWVSFLGNQIDFEGKVRIRQETIERHIEKLRKERDKFAWWMKKKDFSRLEEQTLCTRYVLKMISKGIGFMNAGEISDDGMCWLAAFPAAVDNYSKDCERQMHLLDSVRDRLLWPYIKYFKPPKRKDGKEYERRFFFGRPYSYFGFLKQLSRPVAPAEKKKPTSKSKRNKGKVWMGISDCRFYSKYA